MGMGMQMGMEMEIESLRGKWKIDSYAYLSYGTWSLTRGPDTD